MARKLARHFKTIDALMAAGFEELVGINEVGEKMAQSIIDFFADPENQHIIRRLKAAGLQFEVEHQSNTETQTLSGKTFVISGVFSKYSRQQIKDMIEKYGGNISGSVSSKTSMIVAGDKMGPEKRKKADELNIPIIDETELEAMTQG
jgi:DNA ligase (NAD+)